MTTPSPSPAIPASGRDLLVSETFVSVQGEGASTGFPAAFLRLGNCNLACSFCDTAYTWDATRFDLHHELGVRSVQEIAEWVANSAPGRLIVTGGEPMLQQKQLVYLLSSIDEATRTFFAPGRAPIFVEIETNGTVVPRAELAERVDQWNVSPKLANSGEPPARRLKEAALARYAGLPHAYFKFVVRSERDVREVDDLVARYQIKNDRLLLMPEAASSELLRERAPQVVEWALARRARYSGRLHLELFGGRRGT